MNLLKSAIAFTRPFTSFDSIRKYKKFVPTLKGAPIYARILDFMCIIQPNQEKGMLLFERISFTLFSFAFIPSFDYYTHIH